MRFRSSISLTASSRRVGIAGVVAFLAFPCFGQQPTRIYVGTERGLFRSDDSEINLWQLDSFGYRQVASAAAQERQPEEVFASTTGWLYPWLDAGRTWELRRVGDGPPVSA